MTEKLLTKDEILNANDIKQAVVTTPEWGGHVGIRMMTGCERDAFEASMVSANGKATRLVNIRAKLGAASICDDKGTLLFNETEVVALGKKSAAALDRVFLASAKLSGIGEDAIDELVKNSNAGQNSDSG